MDRENVKQIISELFAAFAEGDMSNPEDILKHLADDAEWWVAGTLGMSGTMTKPQLMSFMGQVADLADGGLVLKPKAWVIEGDDAAIEVDSYMKLKDGREYKNEYHFKVKMRGEKVILVKEYLDTMCAAAIFGP